MEDEMIPPFVEPKFYASEADDFVLVKTTHRQEAWPLYGLVSDDEGGFVAYTIGHEHAERLSNALILLDKLHLILSDTTRPSHNRVAMAQLAFDDAGRPCPPKRDEHGIPLDREGKPLAWPDPAQPEWYIDAWNGCYSSLAEVLADIPSWVAAENARVLAHGERLVDEDEAERRRESHREAIADAFRPGG